jgi:hypothetical protein
MAPASDAALETVGERPTTPLHIEPAAVAFDRAQIDPPDNGPACQGGTRSSMLRGVQSLSVPPYERRGRGWFSQKQAAVPRFEEWFKMRPDQGVRHG